MLIEKLGSSFVVNLAFSNGTGTIGLRKLLGWSLTPLVPFGLGLALGWAAASTRRRLALAVLVASFGLYGLTAYWFVHQLAPRAIIVDGGQGRHTR